MIGVIIQARTKSVRFPNKIFTDINGKCTLQRVIDGVSEAELPNKIILAMPDYDKDRLAKEEIWLTDRVEVYFGNPDNLIDRYFKSARQYGIDLIVRVTADCPLIQGKIIDEMLFEYLENGYNGFMGNNNLVSDVPFPDGTDIEIFPYWMLAQAQLYSRDPEEQEHCTKYMYSCNKPYKIYGFKNVRPNSIITTRHYDLSFDTEEDRVLIEKICVEYDNIKSGTNIEKLNEALLKVPK